MEDKIPFDILFIEDEEALRKNYVHYLKRHFRNVYEAEDGQKAYTIYKENKPHILIIDINIPKLNGLELLAKIREHDHTTKAIMLTAQSEKNDLLEAVSLKLTKYLIKPVTREELKNALNLAVHELSNFDVSSKKVLLLKEHFSWDYSVRELLQNNKPITLTNKERKILSLLFSNTGKTFTYDEIIYDVWVDDDEEDKLDALKTIIKNLRKKLPNETIINVYGSGYKIKTT